MNEEKLDELAMDMARVILPKFLNGAEIDPRPLVILSDIVDDYEDHAFMDLEYEEDCIVANIEIASDVVGKPNELLVYLAHEIIHIGQLLRGDKFNFDLPYSERPEEIEAYELEEKMAKFYEASRYPL